MSLPIQVGDQGQRYEITIIELTGKETRVGWQSDPTGGLVRAMTKAPYTAKVKVYDRENPDREPTIVAVRPTNAERRERKARLRRKSKNGAKRKGKRPR